VREPEKRMGGGSSRRHGRACSDRARAEFAFDTLRRSWQLPAGRNPRPRIQPRLTIWSFDHVAKPEWGAKRICLGCDARYYDFHRSPIVCPACGAVFDLELAAGRLRRARPAPRAAAPAAGIAVVAAVEEDEEDQVEVVDDEVDEDELDEDEHDDEIKETKKGKSKDKAGAGKDADVDEEEDEEESPIEDASELGEDEDDVGEVIDGVDSEEDRS
jgi:uncharacterized protein (TIGR02300 family)